MDRCVAAGEPQITSYTCVRCDTSHCVNFCVAQESHAIQRDPHQYDINIHAEIIIYPINYWYIDVDNDDVYRPRCCPYCSEILLERIARSV